MSRDVLGISWLNGRLHASAMDGRRVSASWSCPTPVHDDWEFALALAEAVTQTRFTGSKVMLVLDHRCLLFHVQDMPPAADKVVDQLLQRTVERSQFFEEKAVWSRLTLPPAKGRQRFLLALMPEALLRRLAEICETQGLELLGVFPLAAVFGEIFRSLTVPAAETVLIAADLGGAFHLVLGRGDGAVLFCRTIVTDANALDAAAVTRVSQEINRTLHFAQQQFGAQVTQLFVIGSDAFTALQGQPIRAGLTVQAGPGPEDSVSYSGRVAVLSPRLKLNLLCVLPRDSKRTQKAMALGIAALLGVSLTCAILVELIVHARERAVAAHARQLERQQEVDAQVQRLREQAVRWRAFLQLVGSTNQPPVPELFASYLAAAVPDSIRLTQLEVSRTPAGWNCRIEGAAREDSTGFIAQMEAFDRELQTNIFKLHITDSTHQRLVRGSEAPPPAQQRPGVRANERTFIVTGEIK